MIFKNSRGDLSTRTVTARVGFIGPLTGALTGDVTGKIKLTSIAAGSLPTGTAALTGTVMYTPDGATGSTPCLAVCIGTGGWKQISLVALGS